MKKLISIFALSILLIAFSLALPQSKNNPCQDYPKTHYYGYVPEYLEIDGQEYAPYSGSYRIIVNRNNQSGEFSVDMAGDEFIFFARGKVIRDLGETIKFDVESITLDYEEQNITEGTFNKTSYDFDFGRIKANFGNMIVEEELCLH